MREDARGNHRGGHARRARRGSGRGLSLAAFAKAKTSTYDPRVVNEREKIRASRTVNKYKKLKRRLHAGALNTQGGDGEDRADNLDGAPADSGKPLPAQRSDDGPKDSRGAPNARNLHPERCEKTDTDGTDGAGKAAERTEAEQREALRKESTNKRRTEHKMFKKKTSHGQPVMKYRIEKLLSKLEHK